MDELPDSFREKVACAFTGVPLALISRSYGGDKADRIRSLSPLSMRKALKFFGVILFTLVLFIIVASLALYHLIRSGEFRRFLVSEIEA